MLLGEYSAAKRRKKHRGKNMKIETSQVTKLKLTEMERLDPVSVITEDFGKGQGEINIECYGKVWSAYWGAMGDQNISEFFCICDEHYIAKNLSNIDSKVYDIDAIRATAEEKGIDCCRDDPWNDYEFLTSMYGHDPIEWRDSLPKKTNHEYEYLCRIIKAVQTGLAQQAARKAA
jgi:hypothetical protein